MRATEAIEGTKGITISERSARVAFRMTWLVKAWAAGQPDGSNDLQEILALNEELKDKLIEQANTKGVS